MASHPCHSRHTAGLTGNPGERPTTSGFPIGRFAAVANDINAWLAERCDIVWIVSTTLSGLYGEIVWTAFLWDDNRLTKTRN
jgi:hypothetical protein